MLAPNVFNDAIRNVRAVQGVGDVVDDFPNAVVLGFARGVGNTKALIGARGSDISLLYVLPYAVGDDETPFYGPPFTFVYPDDLALFEAGSRGDISINVDEVVEIREDARVVAALDAEFEDIDYPLMPHMQMDGKPLFSLPSVRAFSSALNFVQRGICSDQYTKDQAYRLVWGFPVVLDRDLTGTGCEVLPDYVIGDQSDYGFVIAAADGPHPTATYFEFIPMVQDADGAPAFLPISSVPHLHTWDSSRWPVGKIAFDRRMIRVLDKVTMVEPGIVNLSLVERGKRELPVALNILTDNSLYRVNLALYSGGEFDCTSALHSMIAPGTTFEFDAGDTTHLGKVLRGYRKSPTVTFEGHDGKFIISSDAMDYTTWPRELAISQEFKLTVRTKALLDAVSKAGTLALAISGNTLVVVNKYFSRAVVLTDVRALKGS